MILHHVKKSPDQFVILHQKYIIHIFLHIRQYLISYSFYRCAVCDRICTVKFHHFSRMKRRGHACNLRRFHTDHLDLGIQHLCKCSYAGDQAAAPHRHKDIVNRRKFLDDFHGDRALAGRHIQIIKRMNECIAFLLSQLTCISIGIIINVTVEDNFRTVAFCPVHLYQRRNCRHNDHSLTAEFLGSKCHALGMISCRSSDQPAPSFFISHSADLIVSAPDFISPGMLHVFRLQIYLPACLLAQIFAAYQFRRICNLLYKLAGFFKFLQCHHSYHPLSCCLIPISP